MPFAERNCRSSQVLLHTGAVGADWDFESTAKTLMSYFERQDQSCREFADGANATRAWVQLLEDHDADPTHFAKVQTLIGRGDGLDGTAWVELRLAFEQWLGSRTS